jgi:hypothetical protein
MPEFRRRAALAGFGHLERCAHFLNNQTTGAQQQFTARENQSRAGSRREGCPPVRHR